MKENFRVNKCLSLWDYCIKDTDWEIVTPDRHIMHKRLDINIILEYYWNYNILFNLTDKEIFSIKIIEKKIHIDQQIKLLNMFTDIYGKSRC